jgi:hypothetical protein
MNAPQILSELEDMGLTFRPAGRCLAIRPFSRRSPLDEKRFGELINSLSCYHQEALEYLKTLQAKAIPFRKRGPL